MRDLIYAVRALRRTPAFVAGTVLTLGLGLGALTALFAVVQAVLLAPVAVDQNRVVRIWKQDVERGGGNHPLSYPEFLSWRDSAQTFQHLAAINYGNVASLLTVTAGDQTATVGMTPVSSEFFAVVDGGPPLAGRWLQTTDDGAGEDLAAVASARLWRSIGNGDPSFVGRRLSLLGSARSVVVVGVAPDRLEYPLGTDLWMPIAALSRAGMLHSTIDNRQYWQFHLVGRMASGVSREMALAELTVLNRRTVAAFPADYRPMPVTVSPLLRTVVGDAEDILLFLLAAATLVLLIAGVNVGALMLMRASDRRRDLLVRIALGASSAKLFRHGLAESAILGSLSAVVGVAIALGLVRLVVFLGRDDVPRIERAGVDGTTLAVACAAAISWVLVVTTASTWRVARRGARSGIAHDRLGRHARPPRSLRMLAVVEIAVAVVVTIAAGLLLKSFVRLTAVDLGFNERNLAIMSVLLPRSNYPTAERRIAFHSALVEQLSALPGVHSASPAQTGPFTGGGLAAPLFFEGQTVDDAKTNPWASFEGVLPSFFETLGIPIIRGRAFDVSDRKGGQPVAIVSESIAQRYWPGQDPIGKQLRFESKDTEWITVVGVAGNTRYRDITTLELSVYFPAPQFFYFDPFTVAVRTSSDPGELISSIRRRITEEEPHATIVAPTTMETVVSGSLSRRRTALVVAGMFAVLAVLLAVVGVYGVVNYEVGSRVRELAVRSALGAEPRRLLAAVFGRTALLGAIGCATGTALALATTRGLEALLYEVRPLDSWTFAAAGAALLVLTLGAASLPARRAARVDPAAVLRME